MMQTQNPASVTRKTSLRDAPKETSAIADATTIDELNPYG